RALQFARHRKSAGRNRRSRGGQAACRGQQQLAVWCWHPRHAYGADRRRDLREEAMTDKIDSFDAVTLARSLHEAAVQQIAMTIPAEALDAAVAEIVEFDKIYAAPRP